jgi:hypothetical protein
MDLLNAAEAAYLISPPAHLLYPFERGDDQVRPKQSAEGAYGKLKNERT